MAAKFRLTLAQMNPTVGDLAGNAALARRAWEAGREAGADMVALTEMFITGYNTQDLVTKPAFARDAMAHVEALMADCADGPALGIGGPLLQGGKLYNAYHVLKGGRLVRQVLKHDLPNETVFDEVRLYDQGPLSGPYDLGVVRVGTPICEDAWHEDVPEALEESGAEILLVPNGSPYYRDKFETRLNVTVARVVETGLPLVYLNMIGGQDDQVFDGASFVLNPGGEMVMRMPAFEEAIAHVDFEETDQGWRALPGEIALLPDEWEQDYRVMVEAVREYFRKTGFKKALLGLSGGVDSAIVAAIAADALGPENVHAVLMPSRFSSDHSLSDSEDFAARIGISHRTIPIEPGHEAFLEMLAPSFAGRDEGLTEENIQARIRGVLLMALSNKFGWLVVTTGNKSEAAVGYSTLYGDTAGAYSVIKDVYKTDVYRLARRYNERAGREVIPETVITKAPSAELRPDQRDDQSLPPYDELDPLLEAYIEGDRTLQELIDLGFEDDMAKRITRLVDLSEFKRRQTPLGPRVTTKGFGRDRRLPITNRYT